MAILDFNAANVETQDNFDPLPNAWYSVVMTESEMKPTNAGDGHYLECQLKVIDGDYVGRILWLRLNLDNKNPIATDIAYKQLATICQALGVVQVNDSSELHEKPFQVKVVVRPPKGEYEASNDIKGFKAVDGASAGGSSPAASSGGGQPAWAAKKEAPKQEAKPNVQAEQKVEEKVEAQVEKTAAADTTVESEALANADGKPPWMK